MTLNPHTRLNKKYKVICPRGKSSSGDTYVVRREEDKKEFLLKEFIFSSKEKRDKFLKEIQYVKKFDHPGLLKLHDIFCENERNYIVMDYVKGRTLEAVITDFSAPVPVDIAIKWVIEIGDVLNYLHTSFPSPVLYKDLKPSDIILTGKGRLKLIEFGSTSYYNPEMETDEFDLGTPGYAAPEQCRGERKSSVKSDLFSMGAILFQLLTAYNPSSSPFKFPPMKSLNPSLPDKLENILMKAVAIDPKMRYETAGEFKRELEGYLKTYLAGHKSSPGIKSRGTDILSLSKEKFKEAEVKKEKKMSFIQKVVIAVASILVLAGLISTKIIMDRNKEMAIICKDNLQTVKSILEVYAEDNKGLYPSRLNLLEKCNENSKKYYETPYIEKLPLCPACNGDYYEYKTNYETYTIYCPLHKDVSSERKDSSEIDGKIMK